MYLGASPSGTAGELKITTLTAMISVLKSRFRWVSLFTFECTTHMFSSHLKYLIHSKISLTPSPHPQASVFSEVFSNASK